MRRSRWALLAPFFAVTLMLAGCGDDDDDDVDVDAPDVENPVEDEDLGGDDGG